LRLNKAVKQLKTLILSIWFSLQCVHKLKISFKLNWAFFLKNKIKRYSKWSVSWLRLTKALKQLKALISTIWLFLQSVYKLKISFKLNWDFFLKNKIKRYLRLITNRFRLVKALKKLKALISTILFRLQCVHKLKISFLN